MIMPMESHLLCSGSCLWYMMVQLILQVYEGAVYMNQGKTYLVKHLDLSSKIAWCHEADLKYYTKTREYTDIHVIGGHIVCDDLNFIYFLALYTFVALLSQSISGF